MKFFGIPYQRRQFHYVAGDILVALIAIYLGHALRFGFGDRHKSVAAIVDQYTGASLFFISSTLIVLYMADAYNSTLDFHRRHEIIRIWCAVIAALPLQLLAYAAFPLGWWGRGLALLTSLSMAVLLTVWRVSVCSIAPRPTSRQTTLVVGAGEAGRLILREILSNPEYAADYSVVGFIDHPAGGRRRYTDHSDDDRLPGAPGDPAVLGDVPDLNRLVSEHGVNLIIVALRGSMTGELTKRLLECKARGVHIEDMPTLYKRLTGKLPVLHVSDAWLIFGPVFVGNSRFSSAVQRVADILIALVGAIITLPVVGLAAVAIRLESKGPAFFLQERLGKNERPFEIIKLRTMRNDAEAESGAVWSQGLGDPRVTRLGRFLRRSRIDELPQFYNVLRGDMSIVGPRPEREHFVTDLKERIPFYALRFSVNPGVTGWAQVRYRYGATVEDSAEKLCYELYAVQEMSPALYLLILLKTVQTILLRPGS